MKKEFTEYMKSSIANWDKVYKGILQYEWPKMKSSYENFDIKIDSIPEDIRIALLALFGDGINEKLHTKKLDNFLGDSSIYELLTGTSKYDYSLKDGQDLVKWYIMNYWSFLNK
ncbi:MAG: hypothetical protein K2X86_09005 [Cytophagaceae bacterium]|nr:hypothetical protein [Cytophagaceae bacterium]